MQATSTLGVFEWHCGLCRGVRTCRMRVCRVHSSEHHDEAGVSFFQCAGCPTDASGAVGNSPFNFLVPHPDILGLEEAASVVGTTNRLQHLAQVLRKEEAERETIVTRPQAGEDCPPALEIDKKVLLEAANTEGEGNH